MSAMEPASRTDGRSTRRRIEREDNQFYEGLEPPPEFQSDPAVIACPSCRGTVGMFRWASCQRCGRRFDMQCDYSLVGRCREGQHCRYRHMLPISDIFTHSRVRNLPFEDEMLGRRNGHDTADMTSAVTIEDVTEFEPPISSNTRRPPA